MQLVPRLPFPAALAALVALAGAASPPSLPGQDGRVEPPPLPGSAVPGTAVPALVATPSAMPPAAEEFAPGPPEEPLPTSSPGDDAFPPAVTPTALPIGDLVPAAASPGTPALPTGPIATQEQSRGRVVEIERPERYPLDPDDPESAWWEVNPSFAFLRARREQKPMLLLFTAVWNPQALALSEEVFATRSFHEYVKENLVICFLSYPRNYSDAPDALRRIKDKFKVKGYPNVLVFNPNGEVQRGMRGYRTGRPVDYFNQLVAACRPVLASVEEQRAELVARGYRDWSNYLGKLVFAKFVERDATHLVLLDAAGQRWTLPINDLAPDDQRMAESFPPVAKLRTD
jgi:hypothetical protein